MACLYEYNKGDFDVDKINSVHDVNKINSLHEFFESFLLPHTKENHIEGNLLGQCIVHHGYGKEGDWSETYVHLSRHHEHFREQDKNK